MIHPRTIPALLLTSALVLGCGGASLVLKGPISSACEDTGLKGCPDITEGTLLYVEGNQPAALEKLKAGAAANAPDQLLELAVLLKNLGSLPGVSSYMGPVLEVVTVLEQVARERKRDPDAQLATEARPQAPASESPARPTLQQVITADTDSTQMRTGTFSLAVHPKRGRCVRAEAKGAVCIEGDLGPFILTDLVAPEGCEVFAYAVYEHTPTKGKRHKRRVWRIDPTTAHPGMRLIVTQEQLLVFGANESSIDCELTWSGFTPYR